MDKNYTRLKELGRGGMSTVYLARDSALNRLVAIKVLKTGELTGNEYVRRFFREARITAQLQHPNIIRIFESNFSRSEGIFYIVTEYVEGGDFQRLLPYNEQESRSGSTLNVQVPLRKKLEVIERVLGALDYAHQQGIVHRDVKPSNILLTKGLEPKLCDFGIATALWGQESRYTQTNEVIGTMDYIAPEQKENSKNVDLRADIFSIGVILYQLTTGRKPLGAFSPPGQLNDSIPAQLDQLIMKCLKPLPVSRYKNAHNLADHLREILEKYPGDFSFANPAPPTDGEDPAAPTRYSDPGLTEINPPKTTDNTETPEFDRMVEKLKKGTLAQKLHIKKRFLQTIEPQHGEQLLQLLRDSDSDPSTGGFLAETLIEALGQIKYEDSCSFLIELLSDPYYNKAAATATGEIGCKEAEEKLFKILLGRSETSYVALLPLGKLNSVKSIDLIAEYLASSHSWIKEMALDALAMIKEPRVSGFIENASNKDADANIRAKAKKLLWRLKK